MYSLNRIAASHTSAYSAPSTLHVAKRRKVTSTDIRSTHSMSPQDLPKDEAHRHDDNLKSSESRDNITYDCMIPTRPHLPGLRPPEAAEGNMITAKPRSATTDAGSENSRKRYDLRALQGNLNPEAQTYGSFSGEPSSLPQVSPSVIPLNAQSTPNLARHQQIDMNNGNRNPDFSFTQPPFAPNMLGNNNLQQPFVPQQQHVQQQPQLPGLGAGQNAFNQFNLPLMNNFFPMNAATNSLPFMRPPFFFPTQPLRGAPFDGFPPFPFGPAATAGPMVGNEQSNIEGPTNRRSCSKSPPPPEPTQTYLKQASSPLRKLPSPQPLLVILDLNGTLICRKSRKFPPSFAKRAGVDEFLDTLLKRYKVMIWSSSQPRTVQKVCEKLVPPEKRKQLVVEWGRDMFGLSKSQYSAKIQVYKKLRTVWGSQAVQASHPGASQSQPRGGKFKARKKQKSHVWNQSNTILIDDSKLKALSEPWNIIEIPEFTNAPDVDESNIFPNVLKRLEILSSYDDVSKVLKRWDSNPDDPLIVDPLSNNPPDPQSIPDQHSELSSAAYTEAAQARKELIKARKRERKAARRLSKETKSNQEQGPTNHPPSKKQKKAAKKKAATAGGTSQPANIDTPRPLLDIVAEQVVPSSRELQSQPQPQQPSISSPSAVSSQSDNYLLDRLEESLDVRQD
ncbi:NIF domain protein [Aspergillus sclerotialis]|uniref:NIF domain protein n=1 Tax=Aspergillus sclerotialis TaxID=2070753 RepID=A0A3A2ZSH8_9EURO|nr:NIF domain protein [Aspergillus sclerotialis]